MERMGDRIRFVLYAGAVYAILGAGLAIQALGGGQVELREVLSVLVLGPAAAGIAMWLQHHAAGGIAMLLTGGRRPAEREPALSKARFHMKHARWREAREELDLQWLEFPGHRDVLLEIERCDLDGLHAAAAFAEFLAGAVGVTSGETRAYVLLRLAELNADLLDRREEARNWTSRLLAEFPASRHADTARRLREQLESPPPPAARPAG